MSLLFSQTLTLKLASNNVKSLTYYKTFLSRFFNIKKVIRLPNQKKKTTVLKSPHVNKKSREQFEICQYTWLLHCIPVNVDYFDKIRFFIFRYLPANVSLKVTYE